MNPFTILGAKIFAGTSALLLLALIAMVLIHRHNLVTLEHQRQTIADMSARAEVQNAAIQRLHDQGVQQQQAYDQAVQQGQDAIAQAQPRIRIVRQTANNGCRTPPQVMGAGL